MFFQQKRERVTFFCQVFFFKIKTSTIGNTGSSSGLGETGGQTTEKKRVTSRMSSESNNEKGCMDIKSLSSRPPLPGIKPRTSSGSMGPPSGLILKSSESVHRTDDPDSCTPADRLKFAHPEVWCTHSLVFFFVQKIYI